MSVLPVVTLTQPNSFLPEIDASKFDVPEAFPIAVPVIKPDVDPSKA